MRVAPFRLGPGRASRLHGGAEIGRAARLCGLGGVTAAGLMTSGCSRSPSQDILGSFFPSWLLCLGLGLIISLGSRLAMGWLGFRDDVPVPLLTYLAVALAATFLIWLLWFGH